MFILFLVLNVEGFPSFSSTGYSSWLVQLVWYHWYLYSTCICDELIGLSDDALANETIDLDMRNPPPHASDLSTWRRR